eukprot:m.280566 g.280566  ORF g.280566 m.280566 type:complete len:89 (+) comp54919_c1_seq12:564-830(+)
MSSCAWLRFDIESNEFNCGGICFLSALPAPQQKSDCWETLPEPTLGVMLSNSESPKAVKVRSSEDCKQSVATKAHILGVLQAAQWSRT